jgi:hypothetical protein
MWRKVTEEKKMLNNPSAILAMVSHCCPLHNIAVSQNSPLNMLRSVKPCCEYSGQSNFELEYLGEFVTEFVKKLGYELGEDHTTVPLRSLIPMSDKT